MTKNERQAAVTRARIRRLEDLQDDLLDRLRDEAQDRDRLELELKATSAELRRMTEEVQEYDALRSGGRIVEVQSLQDLPHALIRARIAAGMSQRELAERLGLKEQQIQRYEATDYEGASLERLLQLADALRLDLRATGDSQQVEWATVLRTLERMGIDRQFVERRIAPDDSDEQIRVMGTVARVTRIYGIEPSEVYSGAHAWEPGVLAAVAYKLPRRAKKAQVLALSGYARYLSRVVVDASSLDEASLPESPLVLRSRILARDGTMSLASAVKTLWDVGVAVVPLLEPGAFHAGYWRLDHRPVVVLNPARRSLARWLFDLLHEAGHVAHRAEESLVEFNPGEGKADAGDAGAEANQYASAVIFGDNGDALFERVRELSEGNPAVLQRAVSMVARQENVDASALALNVAFKFSSEGKNWWAAASKFEQAGDDPWPVVRDELLARIRWERLASVDAELLEAALSDGPDAEKGR